MGDTLVDSASERDFSNRERVERPVAGKLLLGGSPY
jgi:hypothetical protein